MRNKEDQIIRLLVRIVVILQHKFGSPEDYERGKEWERKNREARRSYLPKKRTLLQKVDDFLNEPSGDGTLGG